MKIPILLTAAIVLGVLASVTLIESKDNDYFPMELGREFVFKYTDSENSLKIVDLKEKKLLGNKTYNARLMQYSWGKNDTTYFRTENKVVYYYDPKSNTESIHIPQDMKVGSSWISADNAWRYEIVSVDAKLTTPEQKYKDLLVIKATQLQNRDKTKLTEYFNYYQKNVGKIAGVTNGKLMTYKLER